MSAAVYHGTSGWCFSHSIIKMKKKNLLYLTFHQKWENEDFPGGAVVKNPPANAGDKRSIPGPGRSHMLRTN